MYTRNAHGIILEMPEIVIPRGHIAIYLHDAASGKLKALDLVKNMFVNTGKNSLADGLRGTTANDKGIITYCALGTGSTAPALTDTQLQTEIDRKLISTREISDSADNAAVFTTFFNTSEANGTLREAGLLGDDATDTANTGTMFCRSAINRTKTSNDTLTLAWTVIIG